MEPGRYNDLNTYLRNRFGTKVYKLALSGGMTCPNRDGTCGTGGCIFCSEGGSGDFAAPADMGIAEQIAWAKERLKSKLGSAFANAKYIAYFQSFTNTYAQVEYLRKIFTEAISDESVCALSIATRPDCMPDDVVDLLRELNEIKPVWVELGLQTVHDRSAEFIRRGYKLPVFEDAIRRLEQAGIEIIVHVIMGLPGESEGDMLETVRYVGGLCRLRGDGGTYAGTASDVRPEIGSCTYAGIASDVRPKIGSCTYAGTASDVRPEIDGGTTMPGADCAIEYGQRYAGVRGIKLQLLHIISGTDLGVMFENNRGWFLEDERYLHESVVVSEKRIGAADIGRNLVHDCHLAIETPEQYIDILIRALDILPPQMVIHRLTGDAPHEKLLFPMWSANKRTTLNGITKKMKEQNCYQGRGLK